jgi:hypothetical protein
MQVATFHPLQLAFKLFAPPEIDVVVVVDCSLQAWQMAVLGLQCFFRV